MINKKTNGPIALIILDGFGHSDNTEGNAIKAAYMQTYTYLKNTYEYHLLDAAGQAVGLPHGFMGNSEVGHLTLGAGRIIPSTLKKLHDSIDAESLFRNEMILNHLKQLKKNKKALHLMGLLSDAGVHSHIKHLKAFITMAHNIGLNKVFIHAFLDGRDTPARSAGRYLQELESFCASIECGSIASLHGRFYAMDRDNNWDRIEKSYNVLCKPQAGNKLSWQQLLQQSYDNGISDEFFIPTQLLSASTIKSGDGVIFFNFRPDRAHQLTEALLDPAFDNFQTIHAPPQCFITPIIYKESFHSLSNDILFEQEVIDHTLLDEIAKQSKYKVFITAETEKYAHVTYFFKGMRNEPYRNETRVLIPSIKTKNYIDHPEMSAHAITHAILTSLQKDPADFYLINYANADMVGHSGHVKATVKACEVIDQQLKQLYEQIVIKQNGIILITADHGNAEEMIDRSTKIAVTSHSSNPVPLIITHKKDKPYINEYRDGLSVVAPLILELLRLNIPEKMTHIKNVNNKMKSDKLRE